MESLVNQINNQDEIKNFQTTQKLKSTKTDKKEKDKDKEVKLKY